MNEPRQMPQHYGAQQQPYPPQGYGPTPGSYPQQQYAQAPQPRQQHPTNDPVQLAKPSKRRKWPWIVGALAAVLLIAAVAGGGSGDSPTSTPTPAAGAPAAPAAETAAAAGHTVTYQVTGPAKASNVTYTKEGFQMEQVSSAKLPWSKDLTFKDDVSAFSGLSLVAQNGGTSGDITCKILVDGKEVASSTSSGAYAVVTCSGANI